MIGSIYGCKTTGYVRIGEEKSRDMSHMKIGFVPQSDIMHPELTVRQVLKYQCYLRNPLGLDRTGVSKFVSLDRGTKPSFWPHNDQNDDMTINDS